MCPVGKFQNTAGKAFCEEVKPGSLVKSSVNAQTGKVESEPWSCPSGMECDGVSPARYVGGVWHNITNRFPDTLYTCVNDGCPDEGDTEMKCKEGFEAESPLCALCAPGYYKQLRGCKKCEKPRWGDLAVFAVGALVLLILFVVSMRKFGHLMSKEATSHLKICVRYL